MKKISFFLKNQFFQKTKAIAKYTSPDDIVIDIGANVGEFAKQFFGSGCSIKCFEPNPSCIARLEAIALKHNVEVIRAAASTSDGVSDLYLHQNHELDPVLWSSGSSLFKGKTNVDPNNFVSVRTIDLSRYIFELDMPVRVLKIDIEGHEVELLPYLLKTGCLSRVSNILVETHEKKNPSLARPTESMKEVFRKAGFQRISWDWI
ncbi:MAG: FkbM family methyltransferase [Synechococcus sp. MIT S9220]|uniref:FkbM family methyltransferase n=2 Tax=unclassified Synechococcus TaxID=2626047 RepID=UPI00164A7C8D|nr:FkbM family methyltransferase [Synechococcus sp. MIT S9220]NOL48322.1 FkbM family methyltransferase [Synechococcus sp. MIT S9220]